MSTIFLNPGHMCGVDPGAISTYYDVTEADIVAEIGELVRYYLEEHDQKVIMEQSDNLCGEDGQDYFDSVCYHANDAEATLFISLHCNAFNRIACGTEVYHGGPQAKCLARFVQEGLVETMQTIDRGCRDGNHLAVIKFTDMPAILIELAFIDERNDCLKLITMKDAIARSIADSVMEYIGIMEE